MKRLAAAGLAPRRDEGRELGPKMAHPHPLQPDRRLITAMPLPDLCTNDEIARLVDAFYARVRTDPDLGPVFAARIDDWPHHLARLTDFWSSVLRGTARYDGQPMARHQALPELDAALFRRWLALFRETAAAQPNAALARAAVATAERIARSLWLGWQAANRPDALPADLRS